MSPLPLARILVVEDDLKLAAMLRQELTQAGYRPRVVHTGSEAIFHADDEPFDLVVLDLNLPDLDGVEVAERLIESGVDASILMLTARGDIGSRVRGLYAGASDYLTKPFSVQELIARIHVRLRERDEGGQKLHYGELTLDPASSSFVVKGTSTLLPELEFELLRLLLAHPGRLFSREELERRLYGAELPSSNTVEVFIHNLRRKLAKSGVEDVIKTVRNKGYLVL